MKQFSNLILHNRKSQIKNEFHNFLNETFSVKYPNSDSTHEAVEFNNLLKTIIARLSIDYYEEPNSEEVKIDPEEIKNLTKEQIETLITEKIQFNQKLLPQQKNIKEILIVPNISFLHQLKLILYFLPEGKIPGGQISPNVMKFKDGRIDYAELHLDIPGNFYAFNRYVKSNLRHEFFHLYQMNTWNIFGSEEGIYKNSYKYSLNYFENTLLKEYIEQNNIDIENPVLKKTIDNINPKDTSPESMYKVMRNIGYICYYMSPIEMHAFLQSAYESYMGYNLHSKKSDISRDPLNNFEYRLKLLKSIIDSDNKFIFEKVIKEVIGEEIEFLEKIPLNSSKFLEKFYDKAISLCKFFEKKYKKVIELAKIEKGEIKIKVKEDKIITDRKTNESGQIIFITDSLDNVAMYNYPLYESCLSILQENNV